MDSAPTTIVSSESLDAAKDQEWWYHRIEHLVGKSLQSREGNWAGVYRDFVKNGPIFTSKHNYYNQLIVPVLYEIGADIDSSVGYGTDYIIGRVAACNDANALKLILSDSRIKPSKHTDCLSPSVIAGSIECLHILLADGRINPAAIENVAVQRAVEEYQMEALVILLADKRVDPSGLDNDALKSAATYGYADMFKLLLADK